MEPEYLTPREVSALTRRAVPTLAKDRHLGVGIPFTTFGRRVLYSRRDVLAFLENNKRTGTRSPDAGRAA
jgi:hypothetical protein